MLIDSIHSFLKILKGDISKNMNFFLNFPGKRGDWDREKRRPDPFWRGKVLGFAIAP